MTPLTDQERDTISRLLKTVQVAHHIPGRIRLKLNGQLSSSVTEPTADIHERLAAIPCIKDVRVNALARSATIAYESNQQIFHCFESLRDGNIDPLLDYLESL